MPTKAHIYLRWNKWDLHIHFRCCYCLRHTFENKKNNPHKVHIIFMASMNVTKSTQVLQLQRQQQFSMISTAELANARSIEIANGNPKCPNKLMNLYALYFVVHLLAIIMIPVPLIDEMDLYQERPRHLNGKMSKVRTFHSALAVARIRIFMRTLWPEKWLRLCTPNR